MGDQVCGMVRIPVEVAESEHCEVVRLMTKETWKCEGQRMYLGDTKGLNKGAELCMSFQFDNWHPMVMTRTSVGASLATLKVWRSPSRPQRVHTYACVHVCVPVCLGICGRLCARACVYVYVCVCVCAYVRASLMCVPCCHTDAAEA